MATRKPRVVTDCVANRYASNNERIIEYSFGYNDTGNGIGGLITFVKLDNGKFRVELYRHNPEIEIVVGKADTR